MFSCEQHPNSKPIASKSENKYTVQKDEGIRFSYSSKRSRDFDKEIEIDAILYNDNNDTAYFLTTTCSGEQYSLCFDTTRFQLSPHLHCNASFPIIVQIPPKAKHTFITYFISSPAEKKIRLGFDFYAVDKAYKLNEGFRNSYIFDRTPPELSIIWGEDQEIK